jgi:hypothetical protein
MVVEELSGNLMMTTAEETHGSMIGPQAVLGALLLWQLLLDQAGRISS